MAVKRFLIFPVLILVIFIVLRFFFEKNDSVPSFDAHETSDKIVFNRIISMAPNITETLFALGLGNRVAGVTDFCNYPYEAREKAKVGGYFNPNYEAIAALEPDLVFVLPEHEEIRNYLRVLGIQYRVVHNRTVGEILDTIMTIGRICGVEEQAREMVEDINYRMDNIQKRTESKPHPSVLIVISRTIGTGSLKDVCVAGKNTSYDELITFAGGRNAYVGVSITYPALSAEGLLNINPDIIIDLIPDTESKGLDENMFLKEWESVSSLEAVNNNRVYIISNDYAFIPGPRFIIFLEDLARIICPEIKTSSL
ncbi:MAG: ABC transporter substrate-binding protein [Candidatus Latescibacteria bacterium]|jgi:iron complex transport system substrate-binding protein|nr:ABC transporter substrate-binding protein [Candidatus Latescibacterota bacterium]